MSYIIFKQFLFLTYFVIMHLWQTVLFYPIKHYIVVVYDIPCFDFQNLYLEETTCECWYWLGTYIEISRIIFSNICSTSRKLFHNQGLKICLCIDILFSIPYLFKPAEKFIFPNTISDKRYL